MRKFGTWIFLISQVSPLRNGATYCDASHRSLVKVPVSAREYLGTAARAGRSSNGGIPMSTTYLGQIMLTGFNFAPRGMASCNGALMSISQQQALFSLLGTIYGGDGVTTFALPDLRSRTPIGAGGNGSTYNIGQKGGSENVTLLPNQIPAHLHMASYTTTTGTARNPALGLYGQT